MDHLLLLAPNERILTHFTISALLSSLLHQPRREPTECCERVEQSLTVVGVVQQNFQDFREKEEATRGKGELYRTWESSMGEFLRKIDVALIV